MYVANEKRTEEQMDGCANVYVANETGQQMKKWMDGMDVLFERIQ